MSKALLMPVHASSAYTYADDVPYALADEVSDFSSPTDEAWEELMAQLDRMRLLKDDWDGEGSPAPAPSLIDGATKLAVALRAKDYPPADRVSASVDGTIYFEWYTPTGYEEIEVSSPLDAERRRVKEGADEADVIHIPIR